MTTDDKITLSNLGTGHKGLKSRMQGGRAFVGRMAALGFTPGATVNVVRNSGHGPVIVDILDTQIALGRGQAYKVHVRQQGDTAPRQGRWGQREGSA